MDHLRSIIDLGTNLRVVHLAYQKPGGVPPTERHVEPYKMMESNPQNLAIRCWQLYPSPDPEAEEGWRCFRIDRILSVKDAGMSFTPRYRLDFLTGEVHPYPAIPPPSDRTNYRKFLDKSILDGELTEEEMREADRLATPLNTDEVRAVHAELFRDLLIEITLDGMVTKNEAAYVGRVGEFLRVLGWSP